MQIFDVLDQLDHTFGIELDRRRRIRRVSRSVAALEGQDPASYRGRRPEDLWEVPEEARRASHACLRTGEVQRGYEVWTGRGDVQRIVQVTRLPSRAGVVVVGEDVTEAMRRMATRALQMHASSRPLRTDVIACVAAGATANECSNALGIDVDTSLLTIGRLVGTRGTTPPVPRHRRGR